MASDTEKNNDKLQAGSEMRPQEIAKPKSNKKSVYKERRKELMKKFAEDGLDSFDSQTILELMIFYVKPNSDAGSLAGVLLERFGSLSEVLDASFYDLVSIEGVNEQTAVFLSMMPELFAECDISRLPKKNIVGIDKIDEYASLMLKTKRNENILLLCLDKKDRLLCSHFISEGGVNWSRVDCRKIMHFLLLSKAKKAIIAHNHPRGGSEPSSKDLSLTASLAKLMREINVELADHVIVGSDGQYLALSTHPDKYGRYLSPDNK